MIRIEKLDKYFNRFRKNKIHVINNTSLELGDNGLVALLGPSGSGKTTLLNVIGGLDKVRKGNIYINGNRITKRFQGKIDKIRNLNIGYIFQDYKLIDDMSVYDNVSIVLKMIGIKDKKEIEKRVLYVLDKVGMLRYKKRPCGMLSGGERQRVGIARAIVKNPSIIIADEPTGNLDSKNSLEIMNIIKAISKDKLVILVTHEVNLAKFYAERIIELEDGIIINDYINYNEADLDYEISNTLYLKDYKYLESFKDKIRVYYDEEDTKLNIDIVVSNNNIYIRTKDNKKIEVIDSESTIEMVDKHHKNISKKDTDKYKFDFNNIINQDKKLRYSSIFNPITFITNGFNKVFNYSLIKKILLGGFLLSGIFIMFAVSSISASLTIHDEDFVKVNKNYLKIETKKIKVDDYINYESNLGANYIIPTNSLVKMKLKMDDFYQFKNYPMSIEGSLSSIDTINKKSIIMGRMPENENEIVIDIMVIERAQGNELAKMFGLNKKSNFIDREIIIPSMDNLKIVGICDNNSPSIYTSNSKFINILYHSTGNNDDYEDKTFEYEDYNLFTNKIVLREGRFSENDYEVIVPFENKEQMKLNKEIDKSINGRKLVVVGYYTSADNLSTFFVNSNTIKYKLITESSDISVYSNNKDELLKVVRSNYKINIYDTYAKNLEEYKKMNKEMINASIISSLIVLGISLIEIILMIRSSFLSRIKEVGIYRAIGVKKKDIYIMFSGEIIAITTLASVPGILICSYILNQIIKMPYMGKMFVVNFLIIISSVIFIYLFNLIVGLLPVFNTLRKRPAEILSRTDI